MSSSTRILIVGGGGREHALAWRCHHEGSEVLAAPGSDKIAEDAELHAIGVGDHDAIVNLATDRAVDLVIVGPEQPLVAGLADKLRASGVATLGPSAAAAELEGSKASAKAFMQRHGIPTARHRSVSELGDALAALRDFDAPPVVKADGLAAGKGVTVPETLEEAEEAVRACLEREVFGAAGATVVLEERLRGEEASFFAVTDGEHAATFEPAQDHKRIGEGDTGPNTGGMGAYAPAPLVTEEVRTRIIDQIVTPTIMGLREEGHPFVGMLYAGLMIDAEGRPSVVEYNVRFGDPEAQPLLFGLEQPLVPVLLAAARGELTSCRLRGKASTTVVLASAGYPASSSKGDPISGLERADAMEDVHVFHAGTRREGAGWVTNGGRVLGVTARAADLREALERAYRAVDHIEIPGVQVRRDIGARALARLEATASRPRARSHAPAADAEEETR
jgi:phosphoribosylamine--glycine ligase